MIVDNIFLGLIFVFGICVIESKAHHTTYAENVVSRDASSRIIAGWDAEDGQIPYQINLRMISAIGGMAVCGGSVIHHEWVLTAAHCLHNRISFVVRAGAVNVSRPDWILDTTNRHLHPLYDEENSSVQTHDIALLRLNHYVPYGSLIRPVRVQSSEQRDWDYTGVTMIASGYGLTLDRVDGGAVSPVLQWVHLRGISNAECLSWYPTVDHIDKETICAEFYNDTAQSTCSGDSGGPLTVIDADGNPTIVGVISFVSSVGCNSSFPSGHVRPGWYHEWMTEVTGLDFDWTVADTERSTVIEDKTVSDRPRLQLQGGSVPLLGEYPNIVHLRMSHWNNAGLVTTCVGSLISNRWVLTTAACLDDSRAITLRFGVIHVPNAELALDSATSYSHPEYDNVTGINDIALIDTVNFIEFSSNIQAIDVAVGDYSVPTSGKLCSWGQNSDDKPGDLLYCLDMSLTEQNDGTIIGYSTQGKTTEFDIGAPLISDGYQIGILSRWPSNGDDYSAVFVQPRYFMEFISNQTNLVFPEASLASEATAAYISHLLWMSMALVLLLLQS